MAGRHQQNSAAPGSAAPGAPAAVPAVVVEDGHGRRRGLAVPVDPHGTLVTVLETVSGLSTAVLRLPGGPVPACIQALPAHGLALLHTDPAAALPAPVPALAPHLDGRPLAVLHHAPHTGAATLLPCTPAGRCTAVRATGPGPDGGPPGALLIRPAPTGTPPEPGAAVVDTATGAVVALAAPARLGDRADLVAALPVTTALPADLLRRNAEAAPAHGPALNLGGVLRRTAARLAAATAGPHRATDLAADRIDRADGLTGEEPPAVVTVLSGAAGTGRSTELAALAVRRATRHRPLPTLWLRGADLDPADRSLADALHRAFAADGPTPADDPAEAAARCAAAGRPLLVILDALEEAPAVPDPEWHTATLRWLTGHGARLLLSCRPENLPAVPGPVLLLGPLPPDTAHTVARHHGADPADLPPAEAAHPQALRTAGELRAAGLAGAPAGRAELYAAALDLRCLRAARRIAAAGERCPGAHRRGAPARPREDTGRLRRTAARVAGRVHEAARLMLGAGRAALPADDFHRLFPDGDGWAAAVLAEGLFVQAGPGYRLAEGDPADWLLGRHLDVDRALDVLLATTTPAATATVPRHRLGAVAAALHQLEAVHGPDALAARLDRLGRELDTAPHGGDGAWWAAALLTAVLPAVPDPTAHRELLARLARHPVFPPTWWAALPLVPADRIALLRRLVRADPPGGPYRAAAAALLAADPHTVMPLLCTWFADTGPLGDGTGATVADLAHDLLHTHRRLALDRLTDTLADAAHPRADALLAVLAAEEPSALCRAADRWCHDPRPERHVAAAVHGLRAAPHAGPAARRLLRHTALTLLAREDEPALHGAALVLLIRDPETRAEHLPRALAAYAADDAFVGADVLAPALAGHLSGPAGPAGQHLRTVAVGPGPAAHRAEAVPVPKQGRAHGTL